VADVRLAVAVRVRARSRSVTGGDEDCGDELIYTVAGGNAPATGRQIADQTLTQPGNAGLVLSEQNGYPVRVIRGANGDPQFSPPMGYRYDGLYRVDRHWSETRKSGFRIWRFLLVRLSAQEAAPCMPPENLPTGTPGPQGHRVSFNALFGARRSRTR
jgi:putative restriction endonuclease